MELKEQLAKAEAELKEQKDAKADATEIAELGAEVKALIDEIVAQLNLEKALKKQKEEDLEDLSSYFSFRSFFFKHLEEGKKEKAKKALEMKREPLEKARGEILEFMKEMNMGYDLSKEENKRYNDKLPLLRDVVEKLEAEVEVLRNASFGRPGPFGTSI
jgi:hypothetical protein